MAAKGELPLQRLRQAVATQVEVRSLREVARNVGMSPSGLQKFLDGSTPYAFTRRKLERWYVRESARYGGSLSVGSAAAALRVLLQELPAPRRVSAADALVRSLADRYRVAAGREPKWLTELRDLIERGDF